MISRSLRNLFAATALLALAGAVLPGAAAAVDAPKWVAAIHVKAQDSVGLRWLPVAGATGYKVLRSTTAGSGYAEIGATAAPQYFDKAIEPGITYYYVLQATAGADVSANSEEKSVAIPGEKKVEKIQPPTWSVAAADAKTEFGKTSYRVGLKWMRPPKGAPVAYNVYRSETPGKDRVMITSVAEDQFVDAAVEPNKTYYYTLTTLDDQFMESDPGDEKAVEIKEVKVEKRKRRVKLTKVPLLTEPVFVLDNNLKLLAQPRGIEVDEAGNVYVTDSVQQKVLVFDSNNEFVMRFGEFSMTPEGLNEPTGIRIGPDGDLYVASQKNGAIQVFRTDGTFQRAILLFKEEKLPPPEPMTFDFAPDGRMFVVDYRNGQVQIFDEDGKYVSKFGNKYDEAGKIIEPKELDWPVSGVFTADGKFALVDGFPHVTVYDQEGNMLVQFGKRGPTVGTFMYLFGIDCDEDRNWIYVSDKTINNIQIFDPEGNFKYVTTHKDGEALMGVANPNGIKLVGNKVYIVENLAQRYSIYNLLYDQSPPPFATTED